MDDRQTRNYASVNIVARCYYNRYFRLADDAGLRDEERVLILISPDSATVGWPLAPET
jgi:hypothetical protein